MGADQRHVKVESSTLRSKGDAITADYPSTSTSAVPPCMLLISGLAMQKLDQNHQQLVATLAAGKAEAARLGACLQAAAHAYDEADARAKGSIESGGASGTDPVPVNPDLPPSAPPAPIGQCTAPPEDPGVDWTSAVGQFDAGDQGSSLLDFAHSLYTLSDQLTAHGKKFSMGDTHWEGAAAEDAEGALRRHESWLYDFAGQTRTLAQQAQDFADVHLSEHPQHPTEADVAEVSELTGSDWFLAYSAKQEQSDEVRRSYASRVDFPDVSFKEPPAGAYPSAPVSPGDVGSNSYLKDAIEKKGRPTGPSGGPGGPGGGGGQPSGGSPQAASPSEKPAAAPAEPQSQESGGEKPGGDSGGGSPPGGEGGGSPSSGEGSGSGGGLPDGLGDGAGTGLGDGSGLPDDGGLKPAAAGVGGGGAGGGGVGGQPLQPSASAPAMGTSAASAGAGPGGGSGGAAGGGGMGGGMGGMGHGGNREGGKEKKRNPNLSPEESLYVEDRPFTDPVIGHTRRTKVEDKKEPK
jgi:hypothetical protein